MSIFILNDESMNFILSYVKDKNFRFLNEFALIRENLEVIEQDERKKLSFKELGDLLHTIYEHFDLNKKEDLEKVGNILLAENYKSYNTRYKKDYVFKNDYKFTLVKTDTDDAHLKAFKVLDCYECQANESLDYESSRAKKIVDKLRNIIIGSLKGYDDITVEVFKLI